MNKNKNKIRFMSTQSKIKNTMMSYNGKLSTEPFDLSLDIDVSKMELTKILDNNSIFFELLKTQLFFNENISANISLNTKFLKRDEIFDWAKFNFNIVNGSINFNKTKFNVSYLEEKDHIGSSEFLESGVNFLFRNSGEVSFNTRRNILTDSAEFYNLSYNYINDCLKAGIAYRREFYTDKDVEPANTLMFTITITPFASIQSPVFSK